MARLLFLPHHLTQEIGAYVWVLMTGIEFDTLSGPGSVSSLNDLSDVTVSSPVEGKYFTVFICWTVCKCSSFGSRNFLVR